MHGEIDLRRGGRIDAEELSRRHPDHGERHIVDENLLPRRASGIAEALLAVAQAQDCHRRGASAIVVGKDQAARRRRHREPAKEVAGDVLALSELRLTFDHHIHAASRFVREEAGQDWRRHFAQALERRKREDGCRDVRTVAVGSAVHGMHHRRVRRGGPGPALPLHRDQRGRVRDRQRAEQDRVHEAVDRRVGADPQRERERGQRREQAVLDHRPQAVAYVLRQLFEQDPGPQRARVLLQQRDITQVAARRPPSLVVGQPVGEAFICFLRQMELQLLAEIVFLAPPLQPPRELAKERGHRSSWSAGFSSNPMARANASHFDCSLASCFRPGAVMR